jgi:hypothetical protein
MGKFFKDTTNQRPKQKYDKAHKAKMIVDGYAMLERHNGNVEFVANYYLVHYTTMYFWLKHYELWMDNPFHSHICIEGVKLEITKYQRHSITDEDVL